MGFVDNFDWSLFVTFTIRLTAAFALTLPVAWNRERTTRIMGLRTFPLVAVASCGFILLAVEVVGLTSPNAQARVIQGLMTGIGFIGGGAILKSDGEVRGTATAVSIWTTGALGASAAYGRYDLALLIGIINFVVLRWLTPVKHHVDENNSMNATEGSDH